MSESESEDKITYEISIIWECENKHQNTVQLTIQATNDSDMDDTIEQLVSDPTFIRDNPCQICNDTTHQEVDWEIKSKI